MFINPERAIILLLKLFFILLINHLLKEVFLIPHKIRRNKWFIYSSVKICISSLRQNIKINTPTFSTVATLIGRNRFDDQ
jgi:hypothetical protein